MTVIYNEFDRTMVSNSTTVIYELRQVKSGHLFYVRKGHKFQLGLNFRTTF